MLGINYWAVIAAAVAAFVQGGLWYSPLLFGKAYLALRGMSADTADTTPPVGTIVAEFVRCVVVALVLAHFVVALDVVDWIGAVELAAWVWVGFQAMTILGSVIHENYPWRLYALHAGDALVKTLLMAVILGLWR